jgi:hypothetical protein
VTATVVKCAIFPTLQKPKAVTSEIQTVMPNLSSHRPTTSSGALETAKLGARPGRLLENINATLLQSHHVKTIMIETIHWIQTHNGDDRRYSDILRKQWPIMTDDVADQRQSRLSNPAIINKKRKLKLYQNLDKSTTETPNN